MKELNNSFDALQVARRELELDKVLALVAGEALTPMAAALVRELPVSDDAAAITAALAQVTALRRLLDEGSALPLESFADLRAVFEKLRVAGVALAAEQLAQLAHMAQVARRLKAFCNEFRDSAPALGDWLDKLTPLRDFEQAVHKAIDGATFEVLDNASPALRRIRRDIEAAQQGVQKRLQQILRNAAQKELLQEDVITMRDGRFVLLVKDEFRRSVSGIVHDRSASGQTLFIEPVETVELNNRVRQLQIDEREEIQRILQALTAQAQAHAAELRRNYDALIAFDVLHAKTRFSRRFEGAAPVVSDNGKVVLYAARHPLLLERFKDGGSVVPLTIELGESFTSLIITGPNAGGKTVAMKTLGLCVLMARAGLHIPASPDSEIGLLGAIFVDIGDQQSIENDLSTFTSHLVRLRAMLAAATADDLVLIDEMGSGTDPEEGVALAVAVLEHFRERGVRCVATTHHGALKAFAHETEGVENGSMIFDTETLEPTYRFRAGVPGSSYAFDIASRVGLPGRIIARSRQLTGVEKGRVEQLIADLENKIQEQEKLISQLKLEETRLTGLAKLYKERAELLAKNERQLKQQAVEESEAILARANKVIEETVRSIRERQAATEAIREAKARLAAEKESLASERRKLAPAPREAPEETDGAAAEEIGPGVTVMWKPQRARATALEKPDSEQRVLIQAGSVRMRVPVRDLAVLAERKAKSAAKVQVSQTPAMSMELDVRGMRAEEAIDAVDRYISDALVSGLDLIRIIHGKGTGALRRAVTDHLQGHPQVADFAIAPMEQGGYGVTDVRLA